MNIRWEPGTQKWLVRYVVDSLPRMVAVAVLLSGSSLLVGRLSDHLLSGVALWLGAWLSVTLFARWPVVTCLRDFVIGGIVLLPALGSAGARYAVCWTVRGEMDLGAWGMRLASACSAANTRAALVLIFAPMMIVYGVCFLGFRLLVRPKSSGK